MLRITNTIGWELMLHIKAKGDVWRWRPIWKI